MLRAYTGSPTVRTNGSVTRGGLTGAGKKSRGSAAILPALGKREVGVVRVMGGRADVIESGGLLLSTPTSHQDGFKIKLIITA